MSSVACILVDAVLWSYRETTTVDSSETGTNLRGTMVGSSLSASRECDIEAPESADAFLSTFALSLHLSVSEDEISSNSFRSSAN